MFVNNTQKAVKWESLGPTGLSRHANIRRGRNIRIRFISSFKVHICEVEIKDYIQNKHLNSYHRVPGKPDLPVSYTTAMLYAYCFLVTKQARNIFQGFTRLLFRYFQSDR
jgi:hypothetical protein